MATQVFPRQWVLGDLFCFFTLLLLLRYSTISMHFYGNRKINMCKANISILSPILFTAQLDPMPLVNVLSSDALKHKAGFDLELLLGLNDVFPLKFHNFK